MDAPPPLTLAQLLAQYNAMLGWSQADLAQATGKDPAEISRLLSGKTRRPQISTLVLIAQAYQRAGLEGLTIEHLLAARDQPEPRGNPWNIPDNWLRLMQTILTLDQTTQDALYRIYSAQLHELLWLLNLRFPPAPGEDVEE